MLGTVDDAVIECLPVFLWSDAFEDGVCYDRSRIVADHAASMARAGPFRKELILTCNVCKALLNLLIDRRIYEVQEREECAERVPESSVSIKVAVAYLAVVWAVMDRLA